MTRVTAIAPANIAFTKFWGWRDEALTLPFHDTISMSLSECWSRTTVIETSRDTDDVVLLDEKGEEIAAGADFRARIVAHLDFLRGRLSGRRAGSGPRFRVVTTNSMPMATGVASSASGFAALTMAASRALGLAADERQLSIWARLSGSGSASRSIPDGFVRWRAGTCPDGSDSFSESLFPPHHWALADILAVVDTAVKTVSSREGHRAAPTSPLFGTRLAAMPARNERAASALRERDLAALGDLLEEEAISLHEIAETCARPIRFRNRATLAVTARVQALRSEGLAAWFTLDAGPNVHVITTSEAADQARRALETMSEVHYTMTNVPARGSRFDERHIG